MSENTGFIKLIKSEQAMDLMLEHPNAFMLLTHIAWRARRTDGLKLKTGQALVGDYKKMKLTHQKYRTALVVLSKHGFVTTKTTNKGTIATLLNTDVYDINANLANNQNNKQVTNKQQTSNKQITTNKKERKKEVKKEINHRGDFSDLWKYLPSEIKETFSEYKSHRELMKKPLSAIAEKNALKKLKDLRWKEFYTIEELNEILSQSIVNSWVGLFPLKQRKASTVEMGNVKNYLETLHQKLSPENHNQSNGANLSKRAKEFAEKNTSSLILSEHAPEGRIDSPEDIKKLLGV